MKICKVNNLNLKEMVMPKDTDDSLKMPSDVCWGTDTDDSLKYEGFDVDDSVFTIIPASETEEETTPSAPTPGVDIGISTLLNGLIRTTWGTIDEYNGSIATICSEKSENNEALLKILTDIVNEENKHIGQLQTALNLVSPNVVSIHDGEVEAMQQIHDIARPGMTVQPFKIDTNTMGNGDLDKPELLDICNLNDIDDTF